MTNLTPTVPTVRPRTILAILLGASIAFALVSLLGQYLRLFHGVDQFAWLGLIDNFDVDEEANFPSYYNALLLLGAAFLLGIVARSVRLAGEPLSRRWLILAVLFFALSVDEAAGIHEETGKIVPKTDDLGGILFSRWVVPYAVVVLLVAWYVVPLLRSLRPRDRVRFVASAVVYVSGALVVELIESAITVRTGDETWRYQLVATTQELAEMVGVSLFIWALLKWIDAHDRILQATVEVAEQR